MSHAYRVAHEKDDMDLTTAYQGGRAWLRRPEVSDRLKVIVAEQMNKLQDSSADFINHIVACLNFDARSIMDIVEGQPILNLDKTPDHVFRLLDISFKTMNSGHIGVEVKPPNKQAIAQILAKRYNLLPDTNNGDTVQFILQVNNVAAPGSGRDDFAAYNKATTIIDTTAETPTLNETDNPQL
jgi:hypothetical protein